MHSYTIVFEDNNQKHVYIPAHHLFICILLIKFYVVNECIKGHVLWNQKINEECPH